MCKLAFFFGSNVHRSHRVWVGRIAIQQVQQRVGQAAEQATTPSTTDGHNDDDAEEHWVFSK